MMLIKKTESVIKHLSGILKEKAQTITRVVFWKIPHNNTLQEDICLKIGRYKKLSGGFESVESTNPKSELTLDNEEFLKLLEFVSNNYEPFKKGVKKYIPIDDKFDQKSIEHIKGLFDNPDKQKVLDFVSTNNILPDDLVASLQNQTKINAVREFETMLDQNLVEQKWQEWFKKNDWVLGSEFVRILDEREIDSANITDYLMQAYDGFLDIIEIKRPEGDLKFWADTQDRGNYVPANDLTKAITQATKYIYEIEREANSVKFAERVGNVKTIKPRCVLIFGRSNGWGNEQKEEQMENSSPNPSFSICDILIQKQISRSFGKSFPQKIVLPKFRPHCSATCPNTWRAEHQRKMSFPLSRKISPPPNQKSKRHFSLVLPREARQWRNDTSVRFGFKPPRAPRVRLVRLLFEKGSSKVYNYSTT